MKLRPSTAIRSLADQWRVEDAGALAMSDPAGEALAVVLTAGGVARASALARALRAEGIDLELATECSEQDFADAALPREAARQLAALFRSAAAAGASRGTGHPTPPELVCPLSGQVFEEPVVAADGEVYERQAIERYISEAQVC